MTVSGYNKYTRIRANTRKYATQKKGPDFIPGGNQNEKHKKNPTFHTAFRSSRVSSDLRPVRLRTDFRRRAECSSAGPENAGALQQESSGSSAKESESAAGGAAVGEENGSAASSGTAASGHTSDRSQTTVLEITVEGETERVPATLYTGSGYSIYIPDEGWKVGTGENSVSWTSTDNDRVRFSVTSVTGRRSVKR